MDDVLQGSFIYLLLQQYIKFAHSLGVQPRGALRRLQSQLPSACNYLRDPKEGLSAQSTH